MAAKKISSAPEGFERVFDLVGGHGIFQWRLMVITSLQLIVLTWHHIGYSFLGSVPNHWCSIPQLKETSWTLDQIKLISIPKDSSDFSKCEYFDLDYANLPSSFDSAYSSINYKNLTRLQCHSWEYDKSIYKSTVATEFNLVCSNRWKAATIQGSYMAGGLIGTISFGTLSDRFLGRRLTILISLSIVITGGILASFAKSYWMFVFLRIIIALGVAGSMQNCFVLLTEHSDKKYRALIGLVGQVPFAIGYMILPLLAYYLREWSSLQLSFGLISTHLIIYYWIIPDSPRWLATHGHTDKAINALLKMAKVNKLPRPNKGDLEEIVKECYSKRSDLEPSYLEKLKPFEAFKRGFFSIGLGFKNLMKGEMRRRSFVFWTLFMTVAMVYYGIVFSGNLTSDPYLLIFLGGLMEIPAYTVIVPFVSKLGRRPTTAATFILTGACMLGLTRTPNEYEIIRIILAMSAKLFISAGFAIVYLLGAELYPTELRTTGLAVGIFMGRVGAISAPYIVDLMQTIYRDLPTLIFGIIAGLAGLVGFLLPETKTLEMTDKVVEIEMHAEGEKAKERERKMSWIVGADD